jgi:hypothetical protein
MFVGMKSLLNKTIGKTTGTPAILAAFAAVLICSCLAQFSQAQAPEVQVPAPGQARRLILKDGTYQSVTKYEFHGDRVRYFSAERGEWEEVPNTLIDWDATDKFEQGRQGGKLAPEAAALDKEIDSERKAELARAPEVAPGLRLPDETGIFLLDTYENQPQLAELQQSGADIDQNTRTNILRTAINPVAGSKQAIELPGPHAKVQSHSATPSLYVNIDSNDGATGTVPAAGDPPPLPATERYKIIRIEVKNGKRVAGVLKIAVTGKTKTDERFVSATVTAMTGGWIKLTPTEPLATGEYALTEMLGKDGMNLYVWDFGMNPAAPANAPTWKPELPSPSKTDQPAELPKREKQ